MIKMRKLFEYIRHIFKNNGFKEQAMMKINNPSWLKLLSIPISIFILDLFKESKLLCETQDESNEQPYLGCSIRQKGDDGLQVVMVKSGSPAERAGLKVKDIIIEIDGKKIESINEYRAAVGNEKGAKLIKIKSIKEETNEEEIKEIRVIFE
jgi:predicted metalloprotease with PDZ domain